MIHEKNFRCYAVQRRPGRWVAVCVELGCDAEAESYRAVKDALINAIVLHIQAEGNNVRSSTAEEAEEWMRFREDTEEEPEWTGRSTVRRFVYGITNIWREELTRAAHV